MDHSAKPVGYVITQLKTGVFQLKVWDCAAKQFLHVGDFKSFSEAQKKAPQQTS